MQYFIGYTREHFPIPIPQHSQRIQQAFLHISHSIMEENHIICLTPQERSTLKAHSYIFAKVLLLHCSSHSPVFSKLCAKVTREIATYFGHCKYLPIIWCGLMMIYDVETSAKVTFPINYRITRAPLCVASEVDWLLFPCVPDRFSVASICFLGIRIRDEERMSEEKTDFGVVKYGNFVWTFGGQQDCKALKTCGKFNLHSRQWTPFPCTTYPYHSFSPCVYQHEIYLPALVFIPQALEVFIPMQNRYRLTQWQWTHTSYGALEVISDDTLFVSYVPDGLRIVDLSTGEERAKYRELHRWYLGVNTAPLRVRDTVLWGSGGFVLQFQLYTGLQEKASRIINEEYEAYTGIKIPKEIPMVEYN